MTTKVNPTPASRRAAALRGRQRKADRQLAEDQRIVDTLTDRLLRFQLTDQKWASGMTSIWLTSLQSLLRVIAHYKARAEK